MHEIALTSVLIPAEAARTTYTASPPHAKLILSHLGIPQRDSVPCTAERLAATPRLFENEPEGPGRGKLACSTRAIPRRTGWPTIPSRPWSRPGRLAGSRR